MRPFLVFFAVLVLGALALWWGERASRPRSQPTPAPPPSEQAPEQTEQPEAPREDPPAETQGQDRPRLFLRGRQELDIFAEGIGRQPRQHHVEGRFEPLDADGVRYRVSELRVETFDREGTLVERVVAARARFDLDVEFDQGNALGSVRISDGGRIELEEVTVERALGHPLAPLVFEAPRLETFLDQDRLRSIGDERVTITGRGLAGGGQGLDFLGKTGFLALERGGQVTLDREGRGAAAEFSTTAGGPLELERVGDPAEGRLELRAREGGRLVLRDDPTVQVDAHTLRVTGRTVDGRTLLERGDAEGEVVALRGPDRYSGNSAHIDIGPQGEIERLILDQEPEARVQLEASGGGSVTVVARGRGPLTAELGEEQAHFELVGPGRAEVPERDLVIEAQGSLEASGAADGSHGVLLARDTVVVTEGESRLETESLDVLFLASGGETIDLQCLGATRLIGRDEAGAAVTVEADQEARVRTHGGRWVVPLARGVRVNSLGERPFRAFAGRVRDLDWAAQRFVAEEGVSWVGVFGAGDATRAEMRGPDSLLLRGELGNPARVRVLPPRAGLEEMPEGVEAAFFRALEIDLTPEGMQARREVVGELELPDRRWEFEVGSCELSLAPPSEPDAPRSFSLTAEEVRRAVLFEEEERTTLRCDSLAVSGTLREGQQEGQGTAAEPAWAVAIGRVRADVEGQGGVERELHARGSRLAFEGGTARLAADPGETVRVWGPLPKSAVPFEVEALSLTWSDQHLDARRPKVTVESFLLSTGGAGEGAGTGQTMIEAETFRLDEAGLTFTGEVLLQGSDEAGIPIRLNAGLVHLGGDFREQGEEQVSWTGSIDAVVAEGDFVAVYGGLALVRGARMFATRRRAIIEGRPGREALLDVGGIATRSMYLDLDLVNFLVTSERGVIQAREDRGGWDLEYAALRPYVVGEETLIAIVAPRYHAPGERDARADYASVWIHADEWRATGQERLWRTPRELDEPEFEPGARRATQSPERRELVENVFTKLLSGELSRFVRAAYLEGTVEVTERGVTSARASSAYLDVEGGRGWLQDAELAARMDLSGGEGQQRVRIRAGELVTQVDGSLEAQDATLTTSTHDEPGYVIETGHLLLKPREDEGWSFSARPNRVRFASGLVLPLPPLGSIVLDDEGGFVGIEDSSGNVRTIDDLTLGNEARFGTTVGTAVRFPIGGLGRGLGDVLGFDKGSIRGEWYTEGSYLGDRGLLGGVGLELRERKTGRGRSEDFWLNLYAKGLSDGGEDRGLLRVPQEERDRLRVWYHGRGRYPFTAKTWLDLAFSSQTDPGVQAEFYQSDFQRYEERDNYLHLRSADGARYFDVSVKARVDSYRTEVEELPSMGLYGGETRFWSIGGVDLLWGANLDVDVLRRREGDLAYEEPFYDSFGQPDGLGEREVLRATTAHRISAPLRTGWGGLVATPWLEGNFTAWDEGIDQEEAPTRAALLGGLDLTTTLVKRTGDDFIHTISPLVGLRGDLAIEEENGLPVRYDGIDDPLDGDELEVGLRALWLRPKTKEQLDLEVRSLQRRDRAEGLTDSDQIAVLSSYRTIVGGMPFALRFDGRFDPSAGETEYARSTFALRPDEDLIFELSHRRARGLDEGGIFETASLDTRWRIDPKWEIELGQDVAILGSGTLRNHVVLRRFGADFLFELEVEHRAGEGGTTFKVNFTPLFLWKRRPLGILER